MATILNTNKDHIEIPRLSAESEGKFYVLTALWNSEITHSLRDAAIEVLREAGVSDTDIVSKAVPGTVELVNAAAQCVNKPDTEAVIVIGCVIRGDTPHFDYVCMMAANGITRLNAAGKAPVIFGVLTVEDMQQAFDRAGGRLGNKGAEAGVAAIEMANLRHEI